MRAVLLGLFSLAIGCRALRPEMDGRAWASDDRSTYVYEHRGGLVAVRPDGKRTFAVGQGCLADRPDYVFVAGDGRRAVVLGYRATGGSWHHHVEHEVSVACVLELTTGTTRPLADVYPDLSAGDSPSDAGNWLIGAHTGYVYRREVAGPHADVYDGKGAHGQLPIAFGYDTCDVLERADGVLVACERYQQTSPGNLPQVLPTYRYWIDVAELDPTSFPPTLRNAYEIDVKRADTVRLSRDGTRVVWLYPSVGGGSFGGVTELASRRELFALSGGRLVSADFSADGTQLVVLDAGDRRGTLYRLDARTGAERERRTTTVDGNAVAWLADGRILVSGSGGSELVKPSN